MKIRTKSQWPVLFCVGCVGSETEATIAPSQFYSGAEWVLDPRGEVVASSPILVERKFDPLHGALRVDIIREISDSKGLLPSESHETFSLVAVQPMPWKFDGRIAREEGIKSAFTEENIGNVLISSDVQRDASGHITVTRVTNATPLSETEFRSWSTKMLAPKDIAPRVANDATPQAETVPPSWFRTMMAPQH